jgi:rfaE bifunctional protein nucleotidyltransferase chain/domain
LRHRILPPASLAPEDKIVFDWSVLDERLAEWRRHGLRTGFTNGCFDLLHRGHVKLLAEARAACDRLVVGLNSDASTARLKGEGRPINPAEGRAEVLAALEAVDLVVVFEEDTPLELIKRVRPAVLVKGADYRIEEVVGREVVEESGGDVLLDTANRPPAWCAARPRARRQISAQPSPWNPDCHGATHHQRSSAVAFRSQPLDGGGRLARGRNSSCTCNLERRSHKASHGTGSDGVFRRKSASIRANAFAIDVERLTSDDTLFVAMHGSRRRHLRLAGCHDFLRHHPAGLGFSANSAGG